MGFWVRSFWDWHFWMNCPVQSTCNGQFSLSPFSASFLSHRAGYVFQPRVPTFRKWQTRILADLPLGEGYCRHLHQCASFRIAKENKNTRWFKMTLSSSIWRSPTAFERVTNHHPKKGHVRRIARQLGFCGWVVWLAIPRLMKGSFPGWNICSSKWESSPNMGENKKYLKPPCRIDLLGYQENIWRLV